MEADAPKQRNIANEANAIRLRILNVTLLMSVAVGGLAFVRTLVDAIDMEAWTVAGAALVVYAGLTILLLARPLSYAVRAAGFLGLLYVGGVFGLFAAGYLPAPILILVAQNLLASVLFGRRATWTAFGFNLLALLTAGVCLSSGIVSIETAHFYDPTDLVDWLRVTALFAVFGGVAIVSVDVLTRHLDSSLREQAELLENFKGAVQLHEEAERNRRQAESRLREVTGRLTLPPKNGAIYETIDQRFAAIRRTAERLQSETLSDREVRALAATIQDAAKSTPQDPGPDSGDAA
ncbi:MAG: hypothetical protein AAF436_00905 [Myxococcota bacterium]